MWLLHALRVALFVAIVLLIRQRHVDYRARQALAQSGPIAPEVLRKFYDGQPRTGDWDLTRGARTVTDSQGSSLGFVVQTSPECDHIIGYLGPTNVLIAFDTQYEVLGIEVLASGDTVEHLQDVVGNSRFMGAYNGLSWQAAAARRDVDAVSGATLTSLAIIQSISFRLGSPCPSLKFPDPLSVEELQSVFPAAAAVEQRAGQPLVHDVLAQQQQRLGAVVRTSPTSDAVVGYQGPTDTLIVLDTADRVKQLLIRSSYDNQPYVRYVQEDDYFCNLFDGKMLEDLSQLDLAAAEVEGVSGATMTSIGVAQSLMPAAAAALVRAEPAPTIIVAARDVGTVLVLCAALVMTFTSWRGRPRVRLAFRMLLVIYLGLLNGDMLSQALLVGWAQTGVPWRLAPGLVLLTGAALLLPIVSKRQAYCHHICPFGAAQQLVRHRLPWRPRILGRAQKVLAWIRPALLLLVVLVAMLHLPVNLAGIEPFDAFLFWIAGTATLTVAVVGLACAAVVPMAYCRFGCPTGLMLDYVRLHGRSDRITRRDFVAVGLLAVALVV
jgi:uncharacterized protein with FMN-binding domain